VFEESLERAFDDVDDDGYDVLATPEGTSLELADLGTIILLGAVSVAAVGGYAGYRLGGRRFVPAAVGAVGAPVATFLLLQQRSKIKAANTKQCIQDYCNENPKFCKKREDGSWVLFFGTCDRAMHDKVPGGRECADAWNRCHGRGRR
jgi:hypothetical protein